MKKQKSQNIDNMNLSSLIANINYNNCRMVSGKWIRACDVKLFIQEIKKEIADYCFTDDKYENIEIKRELIDKIDKLAGDKLNGTKD